MSHASPELDAYLHRIGYRGPEPGPDLQTLCAIHALHVDAIPFENLSPLLGMDMALDLPALRQKLLADGRGGWCFEHNTLLQHALAELGFTVRPLAARVSWNVPPGVVTPWQLFPRSDHTRCPSVRSFGLAYPAGTGVYL